MSNILLPMRELDRDTQIYNQLTANPAIAQSKDGSLKLKCSQGRRHSGRPSKYWIKTLNIEDIPHHFTAYTEAEAIEKANDYLKAQVQS
jgi:hypothetical protein